MPSATELLDRARELEAALHTKDALGELHVGATLTIGNYLGTLIVSDFMQLHPGSKITLDVQNTAHIIAKVAAFDLDLGLVEGRCQHPDIDVIPWGVMCWKCLRGPGIRWWRSAVLLRLI